MQGVVASGIAFAVQIWCIDRGGPVFVAVYQPVQTLVVALMASLLLGEEFYLGGYIFFCHFFESFFNLIFLRRSEKFLNFDKNQHTCITGHKIDLRMFVGCPPYPTGPFI